MVENIVSVPIDNYEQWQQLRAQNVGASEIGALFGCHEYLSGYALAAKKLGKLDDPIDNEVLKRGRLLEPVARQLLAEQMQDWTQIGAGSYYYDREIHLGCTPDLFVRVPDRGVGIVQIKTTTHGTFANKWRNADTGAVEPPTWIALQAMVEQHLTGAEFAYIAVLSIGYTLQLELIEVPYIAGVIDQARTRTVAFWDMIARGELPQPDYATDSATIARVLRQDDGSELDLTGDNEIPDIVAKLVAARDRRSFDEGLIKDCNARLLHKMGSAQKGVFAGGTITAKTVHRKGYTAQPSEYRSLTVRTNRERAEL